MLVAAVSVVVALWAHFALSWSKFILGPSVVVIKPVPESPPTDKKDRERTSSTAFATFRTEAEEAMVPPTVRATARAALMTPRPYAVTNVCAF